MLSTKSNMLVIRGSSVSRASSVARDQGSKAGSKAGSRAGSRAPSVEPLCDKTINVFKKAIVQLNESEQEEEKFPFVIVNNFVTFNIIIGRKLEDCMVQKASSVEDMSEYETDYEWEDLEEEVNKSNGVNEFSDDSIVPDF